MAKIGEGTLSAMGRLGLKEIRNAINPSKESVADNEVGVYGTATQGEIASARSGVGAGPEQEGTTMENLKAEAKAKESEKGMEGKELDRGMER